jgi:heme exporter protein C
MKGMQGRWIGLWALLILSLFGVAGYFILTNAEFLAMVQVIIYIGGIMVLLLFGIMVSQNIIGTELRQNSPQAPWAAAGSAIMFLFKNDLKWDNRLEGGLEVGTLLAFLLCCQGAIWAKPTWGVWWDWDPRLTTTAVLLFASLGILALRKFVEDPVKRAIWSSVATIIASIDLPIVYYSVKWWNSLHQQQSSPSTVSSQFHLPLRVNAFGVLFLMIAFIMIRTRIAGYRLQHELAAPPLTIGEEAGELA